jgi:hypothetical protein
MSHHVENLERPSINDQIMRHRRLQEDYRTLLSSLSGCKDNNKIIRLLRDRVLVLDAERAEDEAYYNAAMFDLELEAQYAALRVNQSPRPKFDSRPRVEERSIIKSTIVPKG